MKMQSNRSLILFIFGLVLLPKIYSDIFPSLFVIKQSNEDYILADKFTYDGGRKDLFRFSTLSEYPLYNACPEENALLYQTYALRIQQSVTEFEGRPLELFVKGFFVEYNCSKPIKPIVLKFKDSFRDKFTPEGAQLYDIGYLIHEENVKIKIFQQMYENLNEQYDFLVSLTIRINKTSGTIISVSHMITSGRLLEPDPAAVPFPANENNVDIYGFDVDSLYTEENQTKMFSSIFGQFRSTYYDYPDRSLVKVQLAPHEDFLLNTWKLPSFVDLNTAAMWKQLYPQWKKVEIFVRRVARELAGLNVETGTAKILTLPDANGFSKEVYLREGQKSPVSKYFWKLIRFSQFHDKEYTKAVLIILHNDPYTSNQKPICDPNENFGWEVSNENYETGLTYVCPVDEDIVGKLYDEFKMKYEIFNLNGLQKLDYGKDGEVQWVNEDINSKIMSRL